MTAPEGRSTGVRSRNGWPYLDLYSYNQSRGSTLPDGNSAMICKDSSSVTFCGHKPSNLNLRSNLKSPLTTSPSGSCVSESSTNFGCGGKSGASPSGTPPSTHCVINSSCSGVSAWSFRNSPKPLIAPQGGIRRESTSSLMATAQGRTSGYVIREKAEPPSR